MTQMTFHYVSGGLSEADLYSEHPDPDKAPEIPGDEEDSRGRPPTTFHRPEEFEDALSGLVNQDNLKTKLASAFSQYTLYLQDPEAGRPVVHVSGRSGSGKTWAVERLIEYAGLPYTIASSAGISPPGYRGKTMLDVFIDHWQNWKTDYGVIFLDEIDKWCKGAMGRDHESVSMGMRCQAEILKYLERDRLTFIDDAKDIEELEDVVFETKHILFILAGAYQDLEKVVRVRLHQDYLPDEEVLEHAIARDYKKFGMIPELADRIETWAVTRPLNARDIHDILASQDRPRWERRFEAIGTRLTLEDGALGMVSQHAMEQKEAARVGRAMLRRSLDDIFTIASRHHMTEVTVGAKEILSGRIEVPG